MSLHSRTGESWIGHLACDGRLLQVVDLRACAGNLDRFPYVLRILLENGVRCGGAAAEDTVRAIRGWLADRRGGGEIPFYPSRVLMHDTTCGPALVDIAAMRTTLAEHGSQPERLNPVLPVDISTDHSVAVDEFGTPFSLGHNMRRELARNGERYRLMKWAATALRNVRVHPPGTGIMHTLNLERLATVVSLDRRSEAEWVFPDTLIGTDSHTPMINGIGVLGWGVGGLEAESVCFGMPLLFSLPEVIGVRLEGRLRPGVTATDLALTLCERLRGIDLADRFLEFFGPGVARLRAAERAVVANMAPEFGATTTFFPVDEQTLRYLRDTGRSDAQVRLIETYCRQQGLWLESTASPEYSRTLTFDLTSVGASVAGPRRPQDRLPPSATAEALASVTECEPRAIRVPPLPPDGAVAIAAITSCTNTSDPRLLLAAGLLARKARLLGLKPPAWVKTSLAPGSPTALRYLGRAGLLEDLEALGFAIVGYGCTTCIGNSGSLTPAIEKAIRSREITAVAVLSGNRNFPGRVHPVIDSAFLASPPLVIAFAIAGDVNRNILADPVGRDESGKEVHLADLWPTEADIDAACARAREPADYADCYSRAEASPEWDALAAPLTALYPWDAASTYIRRPPFADLTASSRLGIYSARPLIVLGDDITTDHISPAGAIARESAAGKYLLERGADPADLNVFAARRGNWEVMIRGLFTNLSVRNLLDPCAPPGSTPHAGSRQVLPLWRAAARYAAEGDSVVLIAGARYGMGSSRDWAAKGIALLGVRAVLAVSFERIHRSNLIGMGVLPLRLPPDLSPSRLALKTADVIEIEAPAEAIVPGASVRACIVRSTGERESFHTIAAIETSLEVATLQAGGTLPLVLRRTIAETRSAQSDGSLASGGR